MKKYLLLACMLSASIKAQAGINEDLNDFVNGLGYAGNVTSPAAFESQAAGFFGGGSLYARNQVHQYQLVQLDLPSYRAGCGGIDLYMGAMSFISSEKLVDLGRSVMTNGGAYAVDVMLATTIPELKQVRDFLQSAEQAANHSSLNSCEMAQNLVGGIYPKTTASQQKICADQGMHGGKTLFSDYVDARMKCSGDGFQESMEQARNDESRKKQVVYNKNIVWSILQSKSFLASDPELAELVMSLTGTLIIDKEGKATNVPSLASSANLINSILGSPGSNPTVKIWRCTEPGSSSNCLSVALKDITIKEEKTLTARVRKIIESINSNLIEDKKPSNEEINMLSMTSIPVMKFLAVLNSTQYGGAAVDMEEYAALIAHDFLQNYLSELLQEVANATMGSELNEDLIKDVKKRIHEARHNIVAIDPKVGNKLKEKLSLIERMAAIEKQVASELGSSIS